MPTIPPGRGWVASDRDASFAGRQPDLLGLGELSDHFHELVAKGCGRLLDDLDRLDTVSRGDMPNLDEGFAAATALRCNAHHKAHRHGLPPSAVAGPVVSPMKRSDPPPSSYRPSKFL